jgi:hypothetical protein
MRTREFTSHDHMADGFTLPVILVVTGALFILATAILLVANIERSTARLFADRQRAELAARAGLEEIRAILNLEAANDDFVVLQSVLANPITAGREPAPQLFLARGKANGKGYSYRYVPLFSATGLPPENPQIAPPEIEPLAATNEYERIDFSALPYLDKVRAAWLPILDEQGRTVARVAYWAEDMQGKLDPKLAGNLAGPDATHSRASYPFPAPGLNPAPAADNQAPLDQIALFAIEPAAHSSSQGTLGKTLIKNRPLLLSPGSTLAAAHLSPPLARDAITGRLADLTARAAEENLIANLQPYFELPVIPFAPGIAPALAGTPRLNLNALLAKNPNDAVDEMAALIRAALPDFDQRKGGFPEDYVKTLAANALDYADADSNPTLKPNEYRGVDAYPLMSEIALQVNYGGISNQQERKIMTFRFKLFAELFNPTNQPVAGDARLSYEVALPMDSIGSGVGDEPFDSPALLSNPERATHDLSPIDNRYWTRQVSVSLQPNQYQCYLFADVTYRMDVGAAADNIPADTPFSLNETKGASGLSLMWNGTVVERAESVLRQAGLIYSIKNGVITGGFKVGTPETLTKAALPGLVYDDYPGMYYNMGDPRITHYLRSAQLDENAYPENASPNRRNIRLDIYKNDASTKPKVYARMLPSEWPDGGHNADVGAWTPGTNDKSEMTEARFDFPYDPQMRLAAPQLISNRGRFYSATELGRVFDPIMHAPVFPTSDETDSFRSKGKMPPARVSWPDVAGNSSSPFYGGGNTLRIGRPEHPAFDSSGMPGLHAARLLDLFHTGLSRAANPADREGPLTRIEGHVNLNTASRDTLRALAAGALVMDPLLARQTSADHDLTMMPPTIPLSLSAPTSTLDADRIADAIIHSRPFGSTADLALTRESIGTAVFGNRTIYPDDIDIEWTDAAAEEIFARVYEGATVRSRNFRVWVVAQAITPSITPGTSPAVLAEVRKVYTLFANPGERAADGSILAGKSKTTITSSNEF